MKFTKKAKLAMLVGVLVVLAGSAIPVLMRKEPLDLSKEEDPFPKIAMPPQAVYGNEVMDGGSINVTIIDHFGAPHNLFFLIDREAIRNPYPSAYFRFGRGRADIHPLSDPARAKEIAIRLLDKYGKEEEPASGHLFTAWARRELASPPQIVIGRAYEKLRQYLRF